MATTQPIFRSIEIADGLELTLDRAIPDNVMPYMLPGPGNQMRVKPDVIQNAQSITVTLVSEGGPVQSMDFTYDPTANFQDLVNRYSEPLGPPSLSDSNQVATWEDGQTRFTLTAQGSGSGSLVVSTLQDA